MFFAEQVVSPMTEISEQTSQTSWHKPLRTAYGDLSVGFGRLITVAIALPSLGQPGLADRGQMSAADLRPTIGSAPASATPAELALGQFSIVVARRQGHDGIPSLLCGLA